MMSDVGPARVWSMHADRHRHDQYGARASRAPRHGRACKEFLQALPGTVAVTNQVMHGSSGAIARGAQRRALLGDAALGCRTGIRQLGCGAAQDPDQTLEFLVVE
jgi:hypothetical protein